MFRNVERKLTRAISIVLAVLLIAALIPVGTLISGAMGETYTVTLKNGSNETVQLDDVKITLKNKADDSDTETVETTKGVASFGELTVGSTYSVSADDLIGYTLVTKEIVAAASNSSDIVIQEMEKVTVSGVVKDNEDSPYENATVQLSGYTDGTTTTNENGKYSFDVYKGKSYKVKATPKSGDSAKYAVTDEKTVDTSSDSTENLKFELKEYSITVSGANENNGTIVANPSTVKYGGSSTITVTPKTENGYELTSVKDNNNEKLSSAKSEPFSFDIENVQSDHTVEATFALMTYTVSVSCGDDGTATIDGKSSSTVEYGKSADIIITPNKGYDVNSVKCGNDILEVKEVEDSKTEYYATVSDVKSNISVDVSFSASLEGNGDEYTFNSTIARAEDKTYYYGKDENGNPEKAVFTAASGYKGIELVFSDGGSKGSREQKTVEVDKTKTVKNIIVYESDALKSKTNKNVNINLVMDTTAPTITGNADPASWTNGSVKIKGTASDAEESGSESENSYYLTGSFNSWGESACMTDDGDSLVSYNISLSAGTYDFKIKNGSTWYGNDGIIEDSTEKTSSIGWLMESTKGNCKLQATGGYYRFSFNTSSKYLFVTKLAFVPTDSVSSVSGAYEVKLMDGTTLVDTDKVGADGSYSFEVSGEQQKTYKVIAVDKSGNESEAANVEVKIDKTAPVITNFEFTGLSTSDETGNYANDEITVTISASDNMSGINDILLFKKGEKDEDFKDLQYTKSWDDDHKKATFTLKADDFAEPAVISAKAIDNAGNNSEIKKPSDINDESGLPIVESDKFVISTKEALVEITDSQLNGSEPDYKDGDSHWYNGEAKFNVTVKTPDEHIPIKSIKVKLGNADITSDIDGNSFAVNGKETSFSISTAQDKTDEQSVPDNGENKLTVTVKLKNGVSFSTHGSLYIDTVEPEVTYFDVVRADNGSEDFSDLKFGYFHNNQIKVTVTASDATPSSGLAKIKLYKGLEKDSLLGESATDNNGKATFLIPADAITESDGEDVFFSDTLSAVVYDNVSNDNTDDNGNGQRITTENSNIKNTNLMIETIKPIVNMTAKGDNPYTEKDNNNDKKWYSSDVEFTVKVNDEDSGIRSVLITINDKELVNESYYQDDEKHKEESYTVNTSEAQRDEDGWYTIEVTVVDNAGNEVKTTDTVYKDDTAPEITKFDFEPVNFVEGKEDELKSSVEITNYGFFFKEDTKVTISAEDASPSSGVQKIVYYTYDVNKNKKVPEGEMDTVNDQITITIKKDFKGQIYARAVDNVENTPRDKDNNPKFVHPDGTVVESEAMHRKTSDIIYDLPDTDYEDSKGNNLYSKNTKVKVTIEDTYSGIKQLDWKVKSPYDDKNQAGVVKVAYDGKVTSESKDGRNIDCLGKWTAKKQGKSNLVEKLSNTLTISNNSNNIKISFTLTDRAGNKTTKVQKLSIDKNAPIIEVTYSDPSGEPKNEKYFTKRTATITVTERNFDADLVGFDAAGVDDNDNEFKLSELTSSKFPKKGKLKVINGIEYYSYSMNYTYSKNADYTFAVSATDGAGNKTSDENVKYTGPAPREFTVDDEDPIVSVSYDNNSAANGKYFNAPRTATITVKEHNIRNSGVSVLVNNSESPITLTEKSKNTYEATIGFNDDGDYTFSVSATDLAGNSITDEQVDYGSSVATHEFTIDQTKPVVTVTASEHSDFKNGLVLKDGETVNINIDDTNAGDYSIKLTRSRVLVSGESDNNEDASIDDVKEDVVSTEGIESGLDVTSEFLDKPSTGTGNFNANISIPKRTDDVKNDGVYTLTVEAVDLATNDYTDVQDEKTTDFSVNRFGSVYVFNNDLYKLITDNDGYTQKITSDQLKIYEYNPDTVKTNKVEVISNNNSKTLGEPNDYSFGLDGTHGKTEWKKYVYAIKPNNFKNDGAYTVRISSTDEVDNASQTINYDVCKVNFFVDSTTPEISSVTYSSDVSRIALTDGGSANADKLDINFTVEDLIRLDRVEVYVDNMKNPIKTYKYAKSGKNKELSFDDIHNFDEGKFTLNSSSDAHEIKIVAVDKAGNIISTDSDKFNPGYTYFKEITVTTNLLVIWAKSPVFWIVVGGIIVAAGGVTALIIIKRKKKVKAQ